MKKSFKVKLLNKRGSPIVLKDKRGSQLYLLRPGELTVLEFTDPQSLYSPFSEILFRENGAVDFSYNPDWPMPEHALVIENQDGPAWVWRQIGIDEGEVLVMRGLPRYISLSEKNPLRQFSKMIIKRVTEPQRSERFKGFYQFRETLKDILE